MQRPIDTHRCFSSSFVSFPSSPLFVVMFVPLLPLRSLRLLKLMKPSMPIWKIRMRINRPMLTAMSTWPMQMAKRRRSYSRSAMPSTLMDTTRDQRLRRSNCKAKCCPAVSIVRDYSSVYTSPSYSILRIWRLLLSHALLIAIMLVLLRLLSFLV